MADELGGALARTFANGFEDAGLGDAAEIVIDRGPPTAVHHHVEAGGAGDAIGTGEATIKAEL